MRPPTFIGLDSIGLTPEEAKRQAPIVRFAEKAVDFANKYIKEKVQGGAGFLGIDPDHKYLEAKIRTSFQAYSISYNPVGFTLSFDPKYYFEFFHRDGLSEIEKELIVALATFHEYGHHVQSLMKRGLGETNKARIEDTAEYFSGYMLAKYMHENNIGRGHIEKILKVYLLGFKKASSIESPYKTTDFGDVDIGYPVGNFRGIEGHNMDEERLEIIERGFNEYEDDMYLVNFFNKEDH